MPVEIYMSLPDAREVLKVLEKAEEQGNNKLYKVMLELRLTLEEKSLKRKNR